MPISRRFFPIIYLLIATTIAVLPTPIYSAYGFKLDGTLDKDAISHDYFEGNFARVLAPLEAFRSSFGTNPAVTRDDSVFTYKYLSVIYASDPKTRKKGESYMLELIKIVPAVQLIDLYVSDNIESIFRNVKQNYLKSHETKGQAPIREEKSHKWIWWTATGVGVAATTGIVFLLIENNKTTNTPYKVRP